MNKIPRPSGLPHSRAWSLSPPPPRISCVAIGTGGDICSSVGSRSISYLSIVGVADERDAKNKRPQRHPRQHATLRAAAGGLHAVRAELAAGEARRFVELDEQRRGRGAPDLPGDPQLRVDV